VAHAQDAAAVRIGSVSRPVGVVRSSAKAPMDAEDHLENIMNRLAESVFVLSDEAILAETSETGADPQRDAERTHSVFRQASKILFALPNACPISATRSIRMTGIAGLGVITTAAQTCGSFVSFTSATGEMRGEALDGLCPDRSQNATRRREVSRK